MGHQDVELAGNSDIDHTGRASQLAESDRRHQEETAQLIRATEARLRKENAVAMAQTMAVVDYNMNRLRSSEARIMRASVDFGERQ